MSYDTTLGRWLEQDPIGYDDSMNLYQAYRSSPLVALDPTGLLPQLPDPGAGGGVGGGPDNSSLGEQLEKHHQLQLSKWALEQKERLGDALLNLGMGCACNGSNDPDEVGEQAQAIADAVVNAVFNRRKTAGDQAVPPIVGDVSRQYLGGNSYDCGDWQGLVSGVAVAANAPFVSAGSSVFRVVLVDARTNHFAHLFNTQHHWVQIECRSSKLGSGGVTLDPWPTNGKGNLDYGGSASGYSTKSGDTIIYTPVG